MIYSSIRNLTDFWLEIWQDIIFTLRT